MVLAPEKSLRWDLSPLYPAIDSPALADDMQAIARDAQAFADAFRGRVATLGPSELRDALHSLEAFNARMMRIHGFAMLAFSTDTQSPAAKDLLDKTRNWGTELHNLLQFFDLEIKAIPEADFHRLLTATELSKYRYFLARERKFAPHTLTEPEERLMALKAITGDAAWSQLYEEISALIRVSVEVDGELKELTLEEARALATHPDRALRERARKAVMAAFAERTHVLTFIFNTVYQDHAQDVALRHYPSAMAPTLLGDDLDPKVIDALMTAVEAAYPLAQRYFKLKAKALGLTDFASFDTLAPYAKTERVVSFAEGRELVMAAFESFSPDFARIAHGFFEQRRIDVPPEPGKRGGAFCAGLGPELPAYVLLNWTDRLDDVSTLAHELGHGIHFVLAGEAQSPFNYHPITPLAETASTFGEIVLSNHLLAQEKDPAVRLQLLANRLEDAIGTIFRQVMYTRWELNAHARRAEGVVSAEEFSDLWMTEHHKFYGDAVRMLESDRWGWSSIPHIVLYRFYCYSYAFGQLLVYALYQHYRDQGPDFVPKLLDVLRAGGSAPPQEILTGVGVDITDPGFWSKGLKLVEGMLSEFEAALPA
ncbi:Oligoendopeptidase F, plasmid [compost metagenome]